MATSAVTGGRLDRSVVVVVVVVVVCANEGFACISLLDNNPSCGFLSFRFRLSLP